MNARVYLALALLALLGLQAFAQSDLDLNAGKTKLTISVKSDKEESGAGSGSGGDCEDCNKDDDTNSLVIKLPPEPKVARGYVPKNDLPSNDQGSDVLGVVSAPVVTQPVIVAPVIGAQQPPGEACTDNCDAELAPPPVQIAGPTVASKVLHKEIFEDDSYVPVPETQTEARPAMVSVPEHLRDLPPPDGGPTKRCEGDECNAQELPSVGDDHHYHHLPQNVHDAIRRQVQQDEDELARKREDARRRRQDEEDRREEEFQAERRRWRKEALEEEEEEERRRKQAAAADADRFKQKLPAEHRIPATPTEAEDTQADLQLGEADTCGTPPCQKVVVAVCEAPPCAPSPPCGCIGTTPCDCAPALVTPPPCACAGTVPCACAQPCAADDTECHVMSIAEREAKAKEAAEARANEERIKHRTKLEEELRKHQENIDQVARMTRGLRYQYGTLRKQHELLRQQMLASKIALKNIGPDPYKGTEYDIEGPEPKAWEDLGVDDDDEDGGDTIPERPLTNLDTVVKVVKRGVYGMAPEQAAKLLAAAEIQAAQNASEIAATLATDSSIKQQEQIAAQIAAVAVKNADSTLGVRSDGSDVRSIIDKLNSVLAQDAAKAGVSAQSNPSDNSIKRIVSILATMDPKKSSRDILRSIDAKNRELDEQEKNDELSFDWQQSLRKLNSMVQTIGKQHKYQSNKLDTSQINNRIKVCHFLNEWGVLDDYCKWLLYDAFKPHLAPPKPKPAAPAPAPAPQPKPEEPKPAPEAPAPPPPPPPPQPEEDTNSYLPATYGASFGWAHGQAKHAFPL